MLIITYGSATCKNAPSGYPFSCVPQLRARLLAQVPMHSNHMDGLSIHGSQRFHSSLPSPTAKSQTIKIEPIFPSPISRKPKVDLKPGPRLVNAANHTSDGSHISGSVEKAPVSPQPSAVTQSAGSPNPPTSSTNQVSGKPPSKIRIAIADVVKATEQGALAPPPADAGKIGKIWHQVGRPITSLCIPGLTR
jgi:hypothetical protein